jgi:peptidoglycan/xylan/chitin deacetylase (PgdA/CDA1 family)
MILNNYGNLGDMRGNINRLRKKIADQFKPASAMIGPDYKIVSFTFDDVPKSAFETSVPLFKKHHICGTFYLSLSFMEGLNGNENLFSSADLLECHASGNELASHTYHHFHLFDNSNRNFINHDLRENQREIENLNIGITLENFSYPFGEQTLSAKKVLSRFYRTCRGTDHGVNVGKVDLHNLKAVQLYEQKNKLAVIDEILEDFTDSGGWLIFYTHDVQKDYSPFGCSPEYLSSVVQQCIQQGYKIVSVKQALESLNSVS